MIDSELLAALREWPEDKLCVEAAKRLERLLEQVKQFQSAREQRYLERGRQIRDSLNT